MTAELEQANPLQAPGGADEAAERAHDLGASVLQNRLAAPGQSPGVMAAPRVDSRSDPAEVRDVQEKVNQWRSGKGLPPIKEDGLYGPETTKAVKDYQTASGITPANGIASPQTRDRIALETKPEFKSLDPATQAKALAMLDAHPADARYVEGLNRLVADGRFAQMSPADQGRTLNVFDKTTPNGREALMHLLHKDLGPGQPVLQSRGVNPGSPTLLEELDRQASTPLDPRVTGTTKEECSEALLRELDEPGHEINQDGRNDCSAAGATYQLCAKSPAEYARITTDLLTTGKSKLANGKEMTAPPDSLGASDARDDRSAGERLMQSSFLQYAHPGATYMNVAKPPRADGSIDGFTDGSSGLQGDENSRLLEGLFNKPFVHVSQPKAEVYEKVKAEIAAGRVPVMVGFTVGNKPHEGVHVIEITSIDADGTMHGKNPWGGNKAGAKWGNTGPTNTTDSPTPFVTTDGHGGIQSISKDDFIKRVTGTNVPK